MLWIKKVPTNEHIIKHAILKYLRKRKRDFPDEYTIGTIAISTDTNIPIAKVQDYCLLLEGANEISTTKIGDQFIVAINENGERAVITEKYIKVLNTNISSSVKNYILPILAIAATIFNIFYTRHYSEKVTKLETRIDNLQSQIDTLKHKIP